MSDFAARAALSRMNMREIALAPFYSGFASDMDALTRMDMGVAEARFADRRNDMVSAYGFAPMEQRKPFAFANGIAIIPVSGTLINRFNHSYEGYVTGYNFVRRQLQAALADEDVKGLIFDVNSYGGEAAGCFELAADIRASRSVKPSIAVVDSNAYSAGYALASSAGKIVAIPSAGVGSVGVITMHVDFSKLYEDVGIKVTLIYESEHKADGNPFEPLPDAVKASIQAGIHTAYESFVKLVSENLGVDAKVIRETESRTYRSEKALALGLIHAIASPQQAAQAFFDELSGSTSNQQGATKMSTQTNEPGAADQQAATAAAADARKAERTRMNGILNCEEAKGRESMAQHLAMNTDMSVDEAKAMLAVAPKAEDKPAAAANPFERAMEATANPNLGADAANGADAEKDPVKRILSAQKAATGFSFSA